MTEDKRLHDISRRQVLGGLGAIGLASAGTGLGTSAYFNDTESFRNNTLAAGEFDLKMDWQQEYYGPTESWEPVNAFPDTDDDGVQDVVRTRLEIADEAYGTTDLTALSESEYRAVEDAFRAQFADMSDFESPVIELDDVKPGDQGEITISMHLFDNPGYIWLGGSLVEDVDNGITEPESLAEDALESDTVGDPGSGDLAEAIRAKVWYDDDCDNKHDTGPACLHLAVDNTDSMFDLGPGSEAGDPSKAQRLHDALETYVESLDGNDDGTLDSVSVGLSVFADDASTQQQPTDDEATAVGALDDILVPNLVTGGEADPVVAIENGAAELASCPEDSQRVLALVTNGVNVNESTFLAAAQANLRANGGEVDKYVVVRIASSQPPTVYPAIENVAGEHEFIYVDDVDEIDYAVTGSGSVTGPDPDTSVAAAVAGGASEETVIAEGSLREVLTNLPDDEVPGIGGDGGVLLDADRSTPETDCFPGSTTRCLAMLWWLPPEVGNEVQTDRVVFDLDFHAEQCRHNDDAASRAPFA